MKLYEFANTDKEQLNGNSTLLELDLIWHNTCNGLEVPKLNESPELPQTDQINNCHSILVDAKKCLPSMPS